MQVDSQSKIVYVHIPRTGGSWFTYAWPSERGEGDISVIGKMLYNKLNNKSVETGRHGRLSGIKQKLKEVKYDFSEHKIITLVREPFDRIGSSWIWFSKIKYTAERHGWKTIDDMLDEFEGGGFRVNYMPQTYWLEEEGAVWDHIFRFEDLLGNNQPVQKFFPKFNWGQKSRNLSRLGQKRDNFSTMQRERIKSLYKDDFKYLNKFYE
tara:strand:- start:6957 stop:7580 length:624 start_codon:yes stop_codon:yes gene_type:complete